MCRRHDISAWRCRSWHQPVHFMPRISVEVAVRVVQAACNGTFLLKNCRFVCRVGIHGSACKAFVAGLQSLLEFWKKLGQQVSEVCCNLVEISDRVQLVTQTICIYALLVGRRSWEELVSQGSTNR